MSPTEEFEEALFEYSPRAGPAARAAARAMSSAAVELLLEPKRPLIPGGQACCGNGADRSPWSTFAEVDERSGRYHLCRKSALPETNRCPVGSGGKAVRPGIRAFVTDGRCSPQHRCEPDHELGSFHPAGHGHNQDTQTTPMTVQAVPARCGLWGTPTAGTQQLTESWPVG